MTDIRCFWLEYVEPLRWQLTDDDGNVIAEEADRKRMDEGGWHIASPIMVARDGRRAPSRDFGPGAMLDLASHPEQGAAYREGEAPMIGPDGRCLVVQLPPDGHWWYVDGTSKDGGRWTRTGDPSAEPPTVSVQPSILTPDYHGFLTDGVLRGD